MLSDNGLSFFCPPKGVLTMRAALLLCALAVAVGHALVIGVATLTCDMDFESNTVSRCRVRANLPRGKRLTVSKAAGSIAPVIACPLEGADCTDGLANLLGKSAYPTSMTSVAAVLRPMGPNIPLAAQIVHTITFVNTTL